MTEEQARQVVCLLARESAPAEAGVAWSREDREWATRQALALVGEQASQQEFVLARTQLALTRLLPRDATGQGFLARRLWHPWWVLLAMALGLLMGQAVDQLGPPQRVNLLAPEVWAVVAWNLLVYALLFWPSGAGGSAAVLRALQARAQAATGVSGEWLRHAAPLTSQRLLLLMHSAAACLALGLIAGLYLRGLVLDYRVGWQSTFLSPGAVQAALDLLLAPASLLTGEPVADVAPLRLLPGMEARASAAPWIHLYAATLALAVVLPRLLLAAWAAGRAQGLAAHFPLPLDLPGLRALHPLMRPGPQPPLVLLWLAAPGLAPCRVLTSEVSDLSAPLSLWCSPEGDALELRPVPAALASLAACESGREARAGWLRRAWPWHRPDPAADALQALRKQTDAVLQAGPATLPAPAWLGALGRPVLRLHEGTQALPPALPLRRLSDGWLRDGALLQALQAALPDDDRLARLAVAWQQRQAAQLDAAMAVLAQSLARVAVMTVPVPDEGLLARKDDGSAARAQLAQQFSVELQTTTQALAQDLGLPVPASEPAELQSHSTVQGRVGEGRAAVLGAVASGALAGLKADLLSGGLTLGAGAVAGGVLGALGAAGAARGLNAVRGTERSHAAWSDEAWPQLAQALLLPYLQLAHGLAAEEARERLAPVIAARPAALRQAWLCRPDVDALARMAAPALGDIVRRALGGP